MLQKMYDLMRFRNTFPAFDGEVSIGGTEDGKLAITWAKGGYTTVLNADFGAKTFTVTCTDPENGTTTPFTGGKA